MDEMLSAAFTRVRRSVPDAVRITKGATTPKAKRQALSLADKAGARIELHGGRATSSQVLPYVGASAAEVKELPEIVVTVERSGRTGRPAAVFTLRGGGSHHAAAQPASAERDQSGSDSGSSVSRPANSQRDQNRATVVQMDAYRPAPAQAPAAAPEPKRAEPLAATPFRALL
ncbi:hypothetical protein ABZ858_09885 [Streptomyces sp. NPDC047017]|uniref:hypothetical protein n=1 Tax=Streptomyces sp. NPDC047017 TaxID=3155024 RepID=UPI0033C56EE8